MRNDTSSNSLSLTTHSYAKYPNLPFEDLKDSSAGRRAGSFNNLVFRTPENLHRKTIGGKIKQLFSHSGGTGSGGSGDKSSANSSKTNSLTRGTLPVSSSAGKKEKRRKHNRKRDNLRGGGSDDETYSRDREYFEEGEDDDEDLENGSNQSGQSEGDSDYDDDWFESHSDNGAGGRRSASLQYSGSARGPPEGKRRIMKVGGKAVARSKQFPKQFKQALLSPLSAANRNLRPSPSNSSLTNNQQSSDQSQQQQTTPIVTSTNYNSAGFRGSRDDLLSRGEGASGGLNAPLIRRPSLANSDTPLTTSTTGGGTSDPSNPFLSRGSTGGGATACSTSSSFHKPLNLSLSNTSSAASGQLSEKDRQKQQVEKFFKKTQKEYNEVQKKKDELETEIGKFRRRDPGEAGAIMTRYEERIKELKLVLDGYADKLESLDAENELVRRHKLRKRSNSLTNPTAIESLAAGGQNNFDFSRGSDRNRNSAQDDNRSTGSHDQHRNTGQSKQLTASREEDMEHPTEVNYNYATEQDIKQLERDIQDTATRLKEKWRGELEDFKSDYTKKIQDVNESIAIKCVEVETHIDALLTQKLTELDYDLRDRNEMVEQQLATQAEDIHSIDQRTSHQIADVETMYNDRISAMEARLVDIEKSHFSGSGKSNFIEDLKDADVMTLANRILQSLLVLFISFVFVVANILKIGSNTISTPQRAILFISSLTFVIVAYIWRDSSIEYIRSHIFKT